MQDRVVFVTGSARGIGAATARLAAERGARVVLHDRSDSEQLRQLAAEIHAAYVAICDVASKVAVQRAVAATIQRLGRVDVLVNSAGIKHKKYFMDLETEDWLQEFSVNLVGTAHMCQAVLPGMQQQGSGVIVNIASMRGLPYMATTRHTPYCVSKAGVISLTHALAAEFGPTIRVNCVAPGGTNTEMMQTTPAETQQQYAAESALQRMAQPEDIARAVLFLASDESGVVTGQMLVADGGYAGFGR